MTALALLVSTFGYIGFAPVAPGTVGSLGGLLLWWLASGQVSTLAGGVGLTALTAVGVWAASETERQQRAVDPGIVVIDEVVGMLVTLAFVPVGIAGAVVGFFFFRAFDIVKPFPARRSERLPGGWGIMADDVIAGIYANLALRLVVWLMPGMLM